MSKVPVRVFRYPFVFPPEAEDENQHVNNIEYVRMLQESAIAHTRQNGWTPEELHGRGWTWVCARTSSNICSPAEREKKL